MQTPQLYREVQLILTRLYRKILLGIGVLVNQGIIRKVGRATLHCLHNTPLYKIGSFGPSFVIRMQTKHEPCASIPS